MAEQQVFATKGNLILYKKALKLAALGYELLDRKIAEYAPSSGIKRIGR